VKYLSGFVYELKQPYYVWNWFNAEGHDPIWKTQLDANSPAGFDHLNSGTHRYWQYLCSNDNSQNAADCNPNEPKESVIGTGNMYGPGLYAALDPAATTSFANIWPGHESWVLMQIHLPKGLRVVDLTKDGYTAFPAEIQKYFENCHVSNMNGLVTFGMSGNGNVPACLSVVRRLLKQDLKMDALMYNYNASSFSGCQTYAPADKTAETDAIGGYQGPFGFRAFVITNAQSLMKPSDIKVFNSQTRGADENRKMIQAILDISQNAAAYFPSGLWSDIPSQPVTTVTDTSSTTQWLQQNIIGCKNAPPYGPSKK
jgi:hypothetical protein